MQTEYTLVENLIKCITKQYVHDVLEYNFDKHYKNLCANYKTMSLVQLYDQLCILRSAVPLSPNINDNLYKNLTGIIEYLSSKMKMLKNSVGTDIYDNLVRKSNNNYQTVKQLTEENTNLKTENDLLKQKLNTVVELMQRS